MQHLQQNAVSTDTPQGSSINIGEQPANEPHLPDRTYQVEFHGSGGEYFKIWIVNVLLTIVTCYIYAAWAKVRTKRYFYGNTTIDGSSFEYHATGKQLLLGSLLGLVLFISYTVAGQIHPAASGAMLLLFMVAFPWMLWRSLKFNANVSSFRNIRFAFEGNLMPLYGLTLIAPVIIFGALFAVGFVSAGAEIDEMLVGTVAVGVMAIIMAISPWIYKVMTSYTHNNYRYGQSDFTAAIKTSTVYGIYAAVFVMVVLPLLAISATIAFIMQDALATDTPPVGLLISIYPLFLIVTTFAASYFRATTRNLRYNSTLVGGRAQLNSTVKTMPLFWLTISNFLLTLITLGFALPWTKVRSAKFFAKHTTITVTGGMDDFVGAEVANARATGAELADAFDVGMDIGI